MGVQDREDAHTLGRLVPADLGASFSLFLFWVSSLDHRALRLVVSPETTETFLRRAATLSTPREVLDLIVTETGSVIVPLRGVRAASSADTVRDVAIGEDLVLQREHDNSADVDAIAVLASAGRPIGYLAREYARVLAPLLDLEDGPEVTATLATRPSETAPSAEFETRDVVGVLINVRPGASSATG